jgi:hypothetical protein
MLPVKRQRLQNRLLPQRLRPLKQPPRLRSKLHHKLFLMRYHLQHLSQHPRQHLNRRRLQHLDRHRHQQLLNPRQHQFRHNQLLSKLQFSHHHRPQLCHDKLSQHNNSLPWLNQNHQMLNSNHLQDHQV